MESVLQINMNGDFPEIPNKKYWKKLPQLQQERIQDGDGFVWYGNVWENTFKRWDMTGYHPLNKEIMLFRRANMPGVLLIRPCPSATLALNVTFQLRDCELRFQFRAMSGAIVAETMWPDVCLVQGDQRLLA